MITEKLQNAINEQITAEMWSSNLQLMIILLLRCSLRTFILQFLSI